MRPNDRQAGERDPRVDPKSKDSVSVGALIRDVTWTGTDRDRCYEAVDYRIRGGRRTVTTSLMSWRRWAKNGKAENVAG